MLASKLMSALTGGTEDKLYVDDVFSTYLYTGNGSTQTINNGIDLAGKGGLVWLKNRSSASEHRLFDTARGIASGSTNALTTNSTAGQVNYTNGFGVNQVFSSGFGIGNSGLDANNSGQTYVSWTFRKSPKFFDVVTYTGNGVAGRQIPHSLGVAPGMVIVKSTSTVGSWFVYHSATGASKYLALNYTMAATNDGGALWNNTTPSATTITLGSNGDVNASGATYVAYLFAHDDSADGIIQCGSFTTDASGNATVSLGWEPQYLMIKASSDVRDWTTVDSMRGLGANQGIAKTLRPNLTAMEGSTLLTGITATGFNLADAASTTYIYLAIRRPNKPPTSGTEVYNAIARTGTGAAATVTGVGFAPDLLLSACLDTTFNNGAYSRLTGVSLLIPNTTAGEVGGASSGLTGFTQDGVSLNSDPNNGTVNYAGFRYINHFFRRAPGFFDVVCYTGTEVARTVPHSLGVAPELMIVKRRDGVGAWFVGFEFTTSNMSRAYLDQTNGKVNATYAAFGAGAISGQPTGVSFPLAAGVGELNTSSNTVVAYLFASLPGVSKVGAYTGNGTTQTINCGFTTGARFILIKKTSGTGDWLVADTARGIVSAGDPRLSLNTTAAEVTGEDWLDPDATGFIINQTTADANASGASYIFLAIA